MQEMLPPSPPSKSQYLATVYATMALSPGTSRTARARHKEIDTCSNSITLAPQLQHYFTADPLPGTV